MASPDGLYTGGDILPDLFSGSSIFNAGNYQTNGYTASVTQNAGDHFSGTLMYGSGGVLTAERRTIDSSNPDDLRSMIRASRRHAVTARISATSPRSGTHFIASYQWADNPFPSPPGLFFSPPTPPPGPRSKFLFSPPPPRLGGGGGARGSPRHPPTFWWRGPFPRRRRGAGGWCCCWGGGGFSGGGKLHLLKRPSRPRPPLPQAPPPPTSLHKPYPKRRGGGGGGFRPNMKRNAIW